MKPDPSLGTPTLAAPGAGLPWIELQAARLMFRWQLRSHDRAACGTLIEGQRTAIQALAGQCANGAERVLIRRLPGMEDSSRYWSVFMTLEHLRIVNGFVAVTIRSLGRGEVPSRVASTAAVKPDPSAGPESVELFDASCQAVIQAAKEVEDLLTPQRFTRPWFGPLNAAAWYFMAGFHLRLHRAQIEKILDAQVRRDR